MPGVKYILQNIGFVENYGYPGSRRDASIVFREKGVKVIESEEHLIFDCIYENTGI